ncbi:MAG: OmpA family protein, partial [Flavobacteriales bacterium]|nr:OmpA family protein [Flavobacteriales bacterium]
ELNVKVLRKIATTYRRMGDLENCATWYSKTLELDDTNPQDKLFYAEALKSLGQYDEAVYWYAQFANEMPNDSRAQSHIQDPYYYHDLRADSLKYRVQKLQMNSDRPAFGVCHFNDQYLFCAAGVNEEMAIDAQGEHDPFLNIYSCERNKNDEFVNARLVQGDVNSKYHDGPVYFDPHSQTMYITRNNIKRGKPVLDDNGNVNLKIFMSTLENGVWSAVSEMDFNSDEYSTGHAAVSPDGEQLYFVSNMKGGYGGTDIYRCTWKNGTWSDPINLGSEVNTEGDEMFPFVAENGSLFFSSNGHAGLGGQDIFKVDPQGSNWSTAVNLGFPINTRHDDFSIQYEAGEETGYFASNRSGKGSDDIYFFSTLEIMNQILAGTIKINGVSRSLEGEKIRIVANNSGTEEYASLDDHDSFSIQVAEGELIEIFMTNEEFDTDKAVFQVQIDNPIIDTYHNLGTGIGEVSPEMKQAMADAEAAKAAAKAAAAKAAEAAAQAATKTYTHQTVVGVLMNSVNHRPLVGEQIRVVNMSDGTESIAALDDKGMFSIKGAAGERFEVFMVSDAFETSQPITKFQIPGMIDEEIADLGTLEVYPVIEEVVDDSELSMEVFDKQAKSTGTNNNTKNLSPDELSEWLKFKDMLRKLDPDGRYITGTDLYDESTLMMLFNQARQMGDADLVYFMFDESYVGVKASAVLDDVVAQLKSDESAMLFIDAHCDARGTDAYNDALSMERAFEVLKYMVWKGIDKKRVVIAWHGEQQLVNNCDDQHRCDNNQHKDNRRAELIIAREGMAQVK